MYLPAGSQWYYFTDDKRPLQDPVQGGVEFDFYAPWNDPTRDNCAIYIREGAIIPMREIEQYIGELHAHDKMNPITFSVYPGRNSSYKMFLDDDGVTNKAETAGKYRLTEISHEGEAMFIAVKRTARLHFPPKLPFIIKLCIKNFIIIIINGLLITFSNKGLAHFHFKLLQTSRQLKVAINFCV